ncbi:MAG: peptide-binding protein [bacterium]|nr:peptide-binding protein [bacterium]
MSRTHRLSSPKGSLLAGLLLALFLAIPTGAWAAGDAAAPETGDWLIRHLSAEPATLNPVTATDVYEGSVNGYIYESLLERDNRTLDLVPLLAETFEISPDRLSYLFTLRDGVTWQNGQPLTSGDVTYTFDRIVDPGVDSPHLKSYFKDLVKVEALDGRTVRFTFSKPYFKSLEMIGGQSIIPKHLFSKGDFNTHPTGRAPLGTGPYRFVKWDTGKEIVLEKNDAYWGEKPNLGRIVFKIITDDNAALNVLKSGEMDLMALNPIQWVRQTETRKFKRMFDKHKYYLPGYRYIGWNSRRPFFEDRMVRRALTMLVDREAILENLLFGFGNIVTGSFFYEGPDYDKTIEPWPYDPKAAAALLDEAGWVDTDDDGVRDKDGVPFRFEFSIVSGVQFHEQLSTVLKEEFSKVGIEMTIRPLEWALFTQVLDDRTYDAVTLGWSLPVEADPYQVWHSSQVESGSNHVGFSNREADRIIEEARVTFDKEARVKLYRRFHRILHEEQPYTFLFVGESLVAIDRRFENVNIYPLGIDTTEWWVPARNQRFK